MHQQQGHSAAKFYAALVDIHSRLDSQAVADAHHGAPGQLPLAQQLVTAPHSSAGPQPTQQQADSVTQQHAGATVAAESRIAFKPVKFAEPFILDPNTGIMALPPKAATDASWPSAAAAGGGGGGVSTTNSSGRRSNRRQSSIQHSGNLDITNQTSRYRHNSSSTLAHPAAPAAAGASSKRPIERSNIGFKLLQKAGWQEGRGIGAQEQGIAAPLQAMPNKGNTGLGFAPHQQQQRLVLQHPAESISAEAKPSSAAGPVLGSKRVAALVEAELAAESIDAKVKRHRQVMQQEAKDKRDKAIQQYLYRAFNETSDYGVGDNNPLGKNHRLTATNPLLD